MKRILSLMLSCLLLLFLLPASAEDSAAPVMPFRDLSAAEITAEMGTGWNLGNTMDGHTGFMPGETVWQPYVTTQKLITAVHDAGFNTMRLPVTWGLMIDDENGYKIDEAWLSRVQDIADYAVREGMYVIINMHHDGAEQTGWLRIAYTGEELEQVKAKFAAAWQQIAETFRDYDEHIIFESMNEVVGSDNTPEGWKHDYQTIEELNQLFVDTVRATGGHNAYRWLSVPARYTNIVNTLNPENDFDMPVDSCAPARLMLSVHDYDYSFGIQATMGATFWSEKKALDLSKNMEQLKAEYVDKGVPVVLGEYGAVNKNNDGNRAYYYEAINRMCVLCGIIPCAWDIGWYDINQDPDFTFALFDRATGDQLYPGIVSAIMRGFRNPVSGNLRRNILKITEIESASTAPVAPGYTSVKAEQKQVFAAPGEVVQLAASAEPADAVDSLVWASANPAVATVYNGQLIARAPGSTQVTISAQSGDASDTMIVVVRPGQVEKPIASITAPEAVSLVVDEALQLSVNLAPADHTDQVYFSTSDARVVTVNGLGKLVAISPGEATVTIATATGKKATVAVTVTGTAPVDAGEGMPIGIGIYYNDAAHNYYATETGEVLAINEGGTYTISFRSGEHLSAKAKDAGVTDLTGVGAIYLCDTTGQANILESCDIHYDEILLDGVPMTLSDHTPKSALKSNGKFDTNDPLNAWDGSVSPDVEAVDYILQFTTNPAPQDIAITFTLTNWQYKE